LILIIDDYLFLAGGLIAAAWGVAHLILIEAIVKFSKNTRRGWTTSWLAEGVALIFIGVIVCLTVALAGTENDGVRAVTWSAALAMFTFIIVNLFTGFRTSFFPLKAGAFVNGVAGLLFLTGSIINS
jgi:hypothetical protein